jgi:transmembrane sensor
MEDLIVRHLQGHSTLKEQELLRAWRGKAAGNEGRYQAVARVWSLTEAAAPRLDVSGMPDVDGIIDWAGGEEERGLPAVSNRPIRPADAAASNRVRGDHTGRRWIRSAAVGALAASLVAVGFGLSGILGGGPAPAPLEVGEIVTGVGEMTTVSLADGTSIRVGPMTRLRIGHDGEGRVAWLNGRALFAVESDPSSPFTVRTAYGDALVLGTRFEVRTEGEEFTVLVVEGEVEVSAGPSAMRLREGEMSRSQGGAPPTSSRVDDVYAHLDWMGQALVFRATPFHRAIREIERRFGVEVRLQDPRLGEVTVTATFTDEHVDHVLHVLCEIIEARCAFEGDLIRVGASDG